MKATASIFQAADDLVHAYNGTWCMHEMCQHKPVKRSEARCRADNMTPLTSMAGWHMTRCIIICQHKPRKWNEGWQTP